MSSLTVTSSEFRAHMPAVVGLMEKNKKPVTVFRNSKPWFEIRSVEADDNFAPEFRDALQEAEQMASSDNVKTFNTPQELFDDLGI